MRYLIIIATIALTACSKEALPPPPVDHQVVTVTKEVQRPCNVKVPVRPAPLALPLPTDLGQLVAVLGAKLAEWSGPGKYGDRARDALAICTKP